VVVGLGYVGLPLAVALAGAWPVIGFDVDEQRIAELATATTAPARWRASGSRRAACALTAADAADCAGRRYLYRHRADPGRWRQPARPRPADRGVAR
jgi:threonine dehydrogenase-like Zn-dependent dehydrogenase